MRTALRLLALAPAALLALAAGCASNCASTGWQFSVGKPASMMVPTAVQQSEGPLMVAGIGGGPVGAGARATPFAMAAEPACPPGCVPAAASPLAPRGPVLAQMAPQGSCTLDDVCARLERIERDVQQQKAERIALPMPKGGQP